MSDAWNTRLKAAWRGEVPNADLTAMFAATASLSGPQQALEDLKLSAMLDQAGNEWRALLAVGRIAAPLWIADALVGLAGGFYDAETQSHPNRQAAVSPYMRDLIAALLAPVEDIIADVTAALADPGHHTALRAPLRVGPGGDIAKIPLPDRISVAYVRGLLAGATRVHTSAAVTLAADQAAIATPPVPEWLARGIRRLDGEIQAARARLEMSEIHVTSVVGTHSDDAVLAAICRDLWFIVGTAFVAGQMLADPHLLPEAAAAAAASPDASAAPAWSAPLPSPAATARPLPYPTAPAPRPAVRPLALPQIDPGVAPLREHQPDAHPPSPNSPTTPRSPAPPMEVTLPTIGEPVQPPAPERPTPKHPNPAAARPPEAPANGTDTDPIVRFPEIG